VETDPACREAALATGRVLDDLGHHVDEDHPEPIDHLDYMYDYIAIIRTCVAVVLAETSEVIGRPWTPDDVEDGTWVNYQRGLKIKAVSYAAALERLNGWTREVVAWWAEGNDVLVTPTMATPPPQLGFLVSGDDRQRRDRLAATIPYTPQFNVTGQPAISLPMHWTDGGVPVGVQLVAAPGREDLLIRLAAQLEQAVPWAERRPTVSAT
jgi:amidase